LAKRVAACLLLLLAAALPAGEKWRKFGLVLAVEDTADLSVIVHLSERLFLKPDFNYHEDDSVQYLTQKGFKAGLALGHIWLKRGEYQIYSGVDLRWDAHQEERMYTFMEERDRLSLGM